MKRKTKKIVLALVVIGVVAAGGAAFTAANTVPDSVAGYGTTDRHRRQSTDVQYDHTLSADGTHDQQRHPDVHGNLADVTSRARADRLSTA